MKEKLLDFTLQILIFLEKMSTPGSLARLASAGILVLGLSVALSQPGVVYSRAALPLSTIGTVQPPVLAYRRKAVYRPFPSLTARSVLVADLNTGRILYSISPDLPLAPASTTKLMTALISTELYSRDNLIPVNLRCLDLEGRHLYLSPEEVISYIDLMHALLIPSANDAACLLAGGIVPEQEFVDLMNQRSQELGLVKTHFTNPMGFDAFEGTNISSARDIYHLALAARQNSFIREIYGKKSYTFQTGFSPRRVVENTNQLLHTLPGTVGIKTGTTTQAGEVLVYEYALLDKNIMIVLKGSEARYQEIPQIIDWVRQSFTSLEIY